MTYDTTYQVTEHDGIIDSLIIVHQHVAVINHVYVVDSSQFKKWGIDLFGGIIVSESKNNPFGSEFNLDKSQRKSFALGGSVYYNKNPWFLRIGINFRSYQESFLGSKEVTHVQNSLNLVIDTLDDYFVVDPSNDTSYIYITQSRYENVETITNSTEQQSIDVKLLFLEIPFLGGYTLHKDKWHLSMMGGLTWKALLSQKATITDSSGQTASLENSNNSIPFSLHFITSLQAQYNVTERALILAEPIYQTPLSKKRHSFYLTDFMSVNFGLKYYL